MLVTISIFRTVSLTTRCNDMLDPKFDVERKPLTDVGRPSPNTDAGRGRLDATFEVEYSGCLFLEGLMTSLICSAAPPCMSINFLTSNFQSRTSSIRGMRARLSRCRTDPFGIHEFTWFSLYSAFRLNDMFSGTCSSVRRISMMSARQQRNLVL